MKRFFKFSLYLVVVTISFLVFAGIIISVFYSDDIERAVVLNIKSNLKSEINLTDVEFTLWQHFPYASVKFNDLLVYEDEGFDNDTLLFAKEAFIDLSLIDILSKEYHINIIYIEKGMLNIKYDENNKPNYLIFTADSSANKKISIEEVVLIDTKFKYGNLVKNVTIDWDVLQAVIELDNEDLIINAESFSKELIVGKTDYINNKNCSFHGELEVLKDTLFIHKSSLLIENVLTTVSGVVINGNKLDIEIIGEKQQLNDVITHMPERFKKICTPFITDGVFDCKGTIKGSFNKNNNPYFNMDFTISNGDFKLKSIPFVLSNINTGGNINNGKNTNFESTIIKVTDFTANTKNGKLKGSFTINNLNNYFLSAQLNSSWDLMEVNHYFEDSPFFDLNGRFFATTTYQGNFSFNNKFADYFITAEHQTQAKFENVHFTYLNSPLDFTIDSLSCSFDNNTINITQSDLTVSESDLAFIGELDNFIPYLLQKKDKMHVQGNLVSSKLFFDELMTIKDVSKGKSTTSLPDWLSVNLITNVSEFNYDDFTASNLSGEIEYTKGVLRGVDLIANSLEGHMHGSFVLNEPTNKYLVLKANLEFDKIDIRKSFESFNNFNQDFIHQDELNGVGTAELDIEAHWKPSFIFNDKKLKIKSHLIIEQGELIDFKPLESLSSYVSLDDLKHVKFSTLENTIEVENKVITIPAMEIKSSALSVFLSGTHTFEQEIDYSIKLLLSELLSNKFRKKNTSIDNEFGEVNEDGKIFTTVYLKMTGNTEDPKISFDGLKIKEYIQESISTEIETIKTIIKEDILKTEEAEDEDQGQDVIIEWEDEDKFKPK